MRRNPVIRQLLSVMTLRQRLEDRSVSYMLAVPMNQRVIGKTGLLGTEFRADALIACLPGRSWRTRSAKPDATGDRC